MYNLGGGGAPIRFVLNGLCETKKQKAVRYEKAITFLLRFNVLVFFLRDCLIKTLLLPLTTPIRFVRVCFFFSPPGRDLSSFFKPRCFDFME